MAITNNTMVRNIPENDVKKLKKLSKTFNINTTTGVFLRLIPEYYSNQKTIGDLHKKNQKLEGELNQTIEELEKIKASIKTFFDSEIQLNNQKEALLNKI